ncbi:MAG: hypothetical protein JXB07_06155 [Anaerolineae bacterium]|nr:hypothetical protein [Anaerolineae bacterium]
MPRTTVGFIAAATTLFENAGGIPHLAHYGYDAARLASKRTRITAYIEADNRQEAAKGATQQSTREQEAALRALNEWIAQYIKVARIALRKKAQLLEKIGIRARASRSQREAVGQKTWDSRRRRSRQGKRRLWQYVDLRQRWARVQWECDVNGRASVKAIHFSSIYREQT